MSEDMVSLSEAAKLMGVARSTLGLWVSEARFPASQVYGRWLVPRAAVDEYIADRQPAKSPEPPADSYFDAMRVTSGGRRRCIGRIWQDQAGTGGWCVQRTDTGEVIAGFSSPEDASRWLLEVRGFVPLPDTPPAPKRPRGRPRKAGVVGPG